MQQISDCEVRKYKDMGSSELETGRGVGPGRKSTDLQTDAVIEYWDLCDDQGRNLGEQIIRGQSHRPGTYHIVVCVWIRNSQNQILLTLRSKNKKQFPGLWEGLGGSAQAGESSLESVVREVKEEIGLEYLPERFRLLTRLLEKTALVDIYELRDDFAAEDLHLQKEEVDQARWATEEELEALIAQGEFSDAALRRWRAAGIKG